MPFAVSQNNQRIKGEVVGMQQVSELIDGNLVERYDAVGQNTAAIEQKLAQLRNGAQTGNSRAVPDRIKCLEYQLRCANKGAQRLAQQIRMRIMDL